jgi:hypothetical protein
MKQIATCKLCEKIIKVNGYSTAKYLILEHLAKEHNEAWHKLKERKEAISQAHNNYKESEMQFFEINTRRKNENKM